MAIEYGQFGWNEDMIPKSNSGMSKSDLSGVGQGFNAVGGILQAYGIWQAGNDAYASKELQALQYESHINTVKAVSQKAAEETRRQTGLVQSRVITLAAASGAGASDPGVVNLIARQQGYGAYQAALDLYKGEDEARLLKMKAQTARWEGEQAKKASRIGAVSSLLQTAAMAAFMA